jgi:hypothetical protein
MVSRITCLSLVAAAAVACGATSEPPPSPQAADPVEAVEIALPPAPAATASVATEPIVPAPAPADPSKEEAEARVAALSAELSAADISGIGALRGSSSSPLLGPVGVAGSAAPPGPTGTAAITNSSSTGISNAPHVVAGMRAGFRRCYVRALKDDPNLRGKVTVIATVGANGEVTKTNVAKTSLPKSLTDCITARVGAAQFAPPDKAPAKVTIPIQLEQGP